jgi:hypothetical protein
MGVEARDGRRCHSVCREGRRRLGDGDDKEEGCDVLDPNSQSSTSRLHGGVRAVMCVIRKGGGGRAHGPARLPG